jgi:hypothetical protein
MIEAFAIVALIVIVLGKLSLIVLTKALQAEVDHNHRRRTLP